MNRLPVKICFLRKKVNVCFIPLTFHPFRPLPSRWFIAIINPGHKNVICSWRSLADFEILGDYSIYYSFNKTKEILLKYYEKSDQIKMLVDEYDFRCGNNRTFKPKNYMFITVEGAYRRTRNEVAQRLARRISGRVIGNPPQFMIMSNYFYNDTTELRRAFYSLGVHAAACRARDFLTTTPVVIAGYWIDQAAFGLAKMFDSLPPRNSLLYQWPEEVLKPDRVYLINPTSNFPPIPLHPYKPLRLYSFKDKLVEAMTRFKNPSVDEISTTTNYEDIVRILINYINKHFNCQYI